MNSFGARNEFTIGGKTYEIFQLDAVPGSARLPYSLKVLLENLLRNEDGTRVTADQVRAIADWDPAAEHGAEIQYAPARAAAGLHRRPVRRRPGCDARRHGLVRR